MEVFGDQTDWIAGKVLVLQAAIVISIHSTPFGPYKPYQEWSLNAELRVSFEYHQA